MTPGRLLEVFIALSCNIVHGEFKSLSTRITHMLTNVGGSVAQRVKGRGPAFDPHENVSRAIPGHHCSHYRPRSAAVGPHHLHK